MEVIAAPEFELNVTKVARVVNVAALVAVPSGVVTVIKPVNPPEGGGTVAVICVCEFTVHAAATPLKLTVEPGRKFVPLIVTLAPTPALAGVNETMEGAPEPVSTRKLPALVTVPLGAVTLTGPVLAPTGTVAVICVSEFTVKTAFTPLKLTTLVPVKPLPVIVTAAPGRP